MRKESINASGLLRQVGCPDCACDSADSLLF